MTTNELLLIAPGSDIVGLRIDCFNKGREVGEPGSGGRLRVLVVGDEPVAVETRYLLCADGHHRWALVGELEVAPTASLSASFDDERRVLVARGALQ